MDLLYVSRWQFGITMVYHFFMVPLTIGLSLLVAGMQTAWYRTGNPRYLAMTKFWGKLMLVNVAMGVVTGLVQEFQFGMNWSSYSRYVGDVFGAPLAMEGLVAFFVEATFLGLWIFGWDRLSKGVHLACLWASALASIASAYFILAANSWMQHPVGVVMGANGRPRMTDIWAVLTNSTLLAAFPHTVTGSLAVAGTFLVGIATWHLAKHHRNSEDADPQRQVWRSSLWVGTVVGIVAFAALGITGDAQGKLMFQQQPMKMASAEALCNTEQPASFSVFAIGNLSQPSCKNVKSLTVPALLSFLAKGDFTSKVQGVNQLLPQYQQKYGTNYPVDPSLGSLSGAPISYVPNLFVTYWGFRLMILFGGLAAIAGPLALWFTRRGRTPAGKWFRWAALASIITPFLANSFGWIFTEMGRQPWVVAPNPTGVKGVYMFTAQAVSHISTGEILTSLVALTSLYAVLAVVEVYLLVRYVRAGVAGDMPAAEPSPTEGKRAADEVLGFAY